MKMTIDDKAMIKRYLTDHIGDCDDDLIENFKAMNEHIISVGDKPVLVCGRAEIIDFKNEDITYQNDCMVCGNGDNRKWRELTNEAGEHYLMTYDEMLYTFGEEGANVLFDSGIMPEWW